MLDDLTTSEYYLLGIAGHLIPVTLDNRPQGDKMQSIFDCNHLKRCAAMANHCHIPDMSGLDICGLATGRH